MAKRVKIPLVETKEEWNEYQLMDMAQQRTIIREYGLKEKLNLKRLNI